MSGKKILIIDDRFEVVEMIKIILQHKGYTPIVLNESTKAIETIKQEKPDLIIVDIMMPEKDGYQICDEVRCQDDIKHIPIIVLTGKREEKDLISQAYEAYGATDYLVKPFEPDDLLKKIGNLIGK